MKTKFLIIYLFLFPIFSYAGECRIEDKTEPISFKFSITDETIMLSNVFKDVFYHDVAGSYYGSFGCRVDNEYNTELEINKGLKYSCTRFSAGGGVDVNESEISNLFVYSNRYEFYNKNFSCHWKHEDISENGCVKC